MYNDKRLDLNKKNFSLLLKFAILTSSIDNIFNLSKSPAQPTHPFDGICLKSVEDVFSFLLLSYYMVAFHSTEIHRDFLISFGAAHNGNKLMMIIKSTLHDTT